MVWIMVPAGDPTQETVDKLAKLLDRGDTIVDGGNSKWTDDKRRANELKKLGINYVDVGISGGVWGLEVGYCMMVGGPPKAVKRLAPILDVLAPETNEQSLAAIGPRGWLHFGPSGAGHYVKMVHNGVEYGLMQAYAEGFDVFDKCEYELDNAKIAHSGARARSCARGCANWPRARSKPTATTSQAIEGYTEDSGEGRWTIADATAHDVPTPVITASLYARFRSRGNGDFADRVLAALRNQFGGHAVKSAPAAARRRAPANGRDGRARRALSVAAQPRQPTDRGRAREPTDGRARAPAGRADDARHLRRHRRSRQAQTAAGALQPRARGRAARALPPGRRLAQRKGARGLPRGVRGSDPPASRGASPTRTC